MPFQSSENLYSRAFSESGGKLTLEVFIRRRKEEGLEREKGFEPSTLALARRCSNTELFPLDWRRRRWSDSTQGPRGCRATIGLFFGCFPRYKHPLVLRNGNGTIFLIRH